MDQNDEIVCIFCGSKADIVDNGTLSVVSCSHCNRETKFKTYKEMLDLWMGDIRQEKELKEVFPEPIKKLPEADIPLEGVKAYLSQSDSHQILFMEFERDVDLPEHSHEAQIGFVLEGRIDLVIDGKQHTYRKGDQYYIPAGMNHSGKIYRGYVDITFFDEPDRYSAKK